jgi:hypothetical protein
MLSIDDLFKGRPFDWEMIILFLLRAKRDVAAAKAFSVGCSGARAGCRAPSRSTAIRLDIGGARNPRRASARGADENTVLAVFKQSDRTRSSINQTPFGSNAWIEAFSVRLDHHRRQA